MYKSYLTDTIKSTVVAGAALMVETAWDLGELIIDGVKGDKLGVYMSTASLFLAGDDILKTVNKLDGVTEVGKQGTKNIDELYIKHPEGYLMGPDGGLYIKDVDSYIDSIYKSGDDILGGAKNFDEWYNNTKIINKKYANSTFELSGDLASKYPNGVKFKNNGFPDFEPYSIKKVKVDGLNGSKVDFKLANEAAGYTTKPSGYTWHHLEDGKHMILVPTDIHSAVRHTGGASYLRYLQSIGVID